MSSNNYVDVLQGVAEPGSAEELSSGFSRDEDGSPTVRIIAMPTHNVAETVKAMELAILEHTSTCSGILRDMFVGTDLGGDFVLSRLGLYLGAIQGITTAKPGPWIWDLFVIGSQLPKILSPEEASSFPREAIHLEYFVGWASFKDAELVATKGDGLWGMVPEERVFSPEHPFVGTVTTPLLKGMLESAPNHMEDFLANTPDSSDSGLVLAFPYVVPVIDTDGTPVLWTP